MQIEANRDEKFGYFPLIFTQSYRQLTDIHMYTLEKVFMKKHL